VLQYRDRVAAFGVTRRVHVSCVDGDQVWWFVRVYIALNVWGESETKRCVGNDTTIMSLVLCGFCPETRREIDLVLDTHHGCRASAYENAVDVESLRRKRHHDNDSYPMRIFPRNPCDQHCYENQSCLQILRPQVRCRC
jgi:hypothetical protein